VLAFASLLLLDGAAATGGAARSDKLANPLRGAPVIAAAPEAAPLVAIELASAPPSGSWPGSSAASCAVIGSVTSVLSLSSVGGRGCGCGRGRDKRGTSGTFKITGAPGTTSGRGGSPSSVTDTSDAGQSVSCVTDDSRSAGSG
jgi:hypothetical protein